MYVLSAQYCDAKDLGTYDRGIAKVRVDVLKEVPVMTKPNRKLKPDMDEASAPTQVKES